MNTALPEDLKDWYAISCPITGLRTDARMLELMDTDRDGRIRADEVRAAVAALEKAEMTLSDDEAGKALAENLAKQADLAKIEPSDADRKSLADWEKAGERVVADFCAKAGREGTARTDVAAAEAALAAVEAIVDAYFTPPEDMPLVTDAPDVELPLNDHLNPKHQEAILAFAEKCVKPLLGEKASLSRHDWKCVKAAFAPYRAWVAAKPVMNATAKDTLVAEERVLRYRLHLEEFLANFVTMDALYGRAARWSAPTGCGACAKGEGNSVAIFQTGVLRIDGKELFLCFHVENEAAHAALAERSKCCVVYAKLSRPAEKATREICAVVTAGRVAGLYVGRNGVFYDRDGKDWEAVVTKVVAAEVSLVEAFWAPWRKLGETVSGLVTKFFGDRDAAVKAKMSAPPTASAAKEGGAALASSVAAIGIGVGMLGAAAASVFAAVRGMDPGRLALSVLALLLVVSLPSVVLTWFKLRQRDLGAILNACGWAMNRPLRFSVRRARAWTKCAKTCRCGWIVAAIVVLVLAAGAACAWAHRPCCGAGREGTARTDAAAEIGAGGSAETSGAAVP